MCIANDAPGEYEVSRNEHAATVQAVVTRVFLHYIELMQKVQLTYW